MTPKPTSEEPKKPRERLKLSKKVLPWTLVLALLIFSAFMFVQYNEAKEKISTNTPASATQQVDDVVAKVGKLMILPKDQKPAVYTVASTEKLKDQVFFDDAKSGDKVLIYNKRKQAILYRPSTNQIVNVSPVTVAPTGEANLTPQ